MDFLLIQSIDSLESNSVCFPEAISKVLAFDVTGYFSERERNKVNACLQRGGVEIIQWLDNYFDNRDESMLRDELIDWLATMPEGLQWKGRNLKELFTYKKEFSLWWITKLSQKKPNKTPVYQYARIIYRVTEFVERIRKTVANPEDFEARRYSFLIAARDQMLEQLIAESILTAPAPVGSSSNIYFLSKSRYGCYDKAKGMVGVTEGSFQKAKAAILPCILQLRRAFKSMVLTNVFLQKLHRNSLESLERQPNPIVLLGTNVMDFEMVKKNDKRFSWRNIYFGDLEHKLEEAGLDPIWICLSNNRLMDRQTYAASCKYIENDYGSLFSGWGVVFDLLVRNLNWIFLFTKLFLVKKIQNRCKYRGVNMGFLLYSDYKNLCFGHAASLLYYRRTFQTAFKRLRPRAVLYRKEFNAIGRIISSAAIWGCKMISVQHGIVNKRQIGYLYRSNEIDERGAAVADHVYHCPVPDYVTVFGKRMVDYMSSAGFWKHKIRPIGSLRHDAVVNHYLINKGNGKNLDLWQKHRRYLAMGEEDFVLLLCTQWQEQAGDWFEMVVCAIRQLGIECIFVVKPHPQYPETAALIKEKAEELDFSSFRVMTCDLHKLAFCSDVVVTHSSTAVLDAILLRTPVILIQQEDLPNDNTVFTEAQVGESAETLEDMVRALMLLVSRDFDMERWEYRRKVFLEYHLRNIDARATNRLVNLIRE